LPFHKSKDGRGYTIYRFYVGFLICLLLTVGPYIQMKGLEKMAPIFYTLKLSEGEYDPKHGLYIVRSPEYYKDIGIYQESLEVDAPPNTTVLIFAYWTSGPGFTKWDWHGGLSYIFENGSFIRPRGPGLEPEIYHTNNLTYNSSVSFGAWKYWEIRANSPNVTVKISVRFVKSTPPEI